jgi:hypothetical protein
MSDKVDEGERLRERAKAECDFTDRLYEILLAYQRGGMIRGKPSESIPPGRVGELNVALSRVFNQIWASALGLNNKARAKKNQEVNA